MLNTIRNLKGIIIVIAATFFSIMFSSYEKYVSLSKYSLYITFLSLLIIALCEIKHIINDKRITLIVVLIIIANTIFEIVINSTGWGSIIIITILLLMILCSDKVKFNEKQMNIINFIILIGHILFLLSNKLYYNTNIRGYIAFAMLPFSLAFIFRKNDKSSKKSIISVILAVAIIMFSADTIIKSESRGVLLGFITFFIVMIMKSKVFISKKIFNTLIALILICAIGFVFIYVHLWNNNVSFSIPFTDKQLYSGREAIWSELLEQLDDKFMYGLGSNYDIQSFEEMNIHNSLLHILVIYGGINFILFIALLYSMLIKTNKFIKKGKHNKIFMAAIIGMLVVSFFETNLQWTDVNIYFILAVLFCLSSNNENNEGNLMRNE